MYWVPGRGAGAWACSMVAMPSPAGAFITHLWYLISAATLDSKVKGLGKLLTTLYSKWYVWLLVMTILLPPVARFENLKVRTKSFQLMYGLGWDGILTVLIAVVGREFWRAVPWISSFSVKPPMKVGLP